MTATLRTSERAADTSTVIAELAYASACDRFGWARPTRDHGWPIAPRLCRGGLPHPGTPGGRRQAAHLFGRRNRGQARRKRARPRRLHLAVWPGTTERPRHGAAVSAGCRAPRQREERHGGAAVLSVR